MKCLSLIIFVRYIAIIPYWHCKYVSILIFSSFLISNLQLNSRLAGSDTKEDIQKIFELFDDDKTGYISLQNLKRVCCFLLSCAAAD